jgi:release factor glutamine methyltransferase
MNLAEALDWAAHCLKEDQIEDARLESEILLAHALGAKRSSLITQRHRNIETKQLSKFRSYINRRLKHEPTAYIVGCQPFLSLDFKVNRSVLIPRPETELLVETLLNEINERSMVYSLWSIADIGTGSGAIAVSLAKHLPEAKIVGIDSSPEAIKAARENARFHKVENRCEFMISDMFGGLKAKADIIFSNPPYIPTADIPNLQPEVRDWEPKAALDGGPDGLNYIRKLLTGSPEYLNENGYLLFEFGINQAEAILDLAEGRFKAIRIIKDYAGIDRIFKGSA